MIGFTTTQGVKFALIGSHTSTVRPGETPAVKHGCAGCRAMRASPDRAETGTGSVGEADSTRSREAGGAQPPSPGDQS
jgi:hypothetical protein